MAGFALGFLGVIVLMGPDAVKGALSSDLRAQIGLLLATFLYAASAVLSRRAPPIRPRVRSPTLLWRTRMRPRVAVRGRRAASVG